MPKVNRTKYAVLGMLNFASMSGYDIKKAFDMSLAYFWHEDYGHIYPVLKELIASKLATKMVETTEGKPPRHVYSITEEGRAELQEWLLLPASRPNLRIEFLLKIFFGAQAPLENIIAKIEEERRASEDVLKELGEVERHLGREHGQNAEQPAKQGRTRHSKPEAVYRFPYLSVRYGIHYYRSVVEWCDESLKFLREEKNK
jgi:PadR family transcriptional regulator, regulatory protein AphA